MGLRYKTNPQTEAEKRDKKEKLLIAAKIANEEEKRLLSGIYMLQDEYNVTEDFVVYAEGYIEQHSVKDKRKYQSVLKKFKRFMGKERIPCYEITEVVLQRFAKSLENELKGESPHNYFSKLKQIINAAVSENHFKRNPATNIRVRQSVYMVKDVLTHEELRVLSQTSVNNSEVAKAFMFSTLTGLRWVDAKALKWKHIKNGCVKMVQSKTNVSVSIPLNADACELLGDQRDDEKLVFDLPSHNSACKTLKKWMQDAGIEKHITPHCARHTFGTSLITYGVDVSIASKLLGHTSLANTQRYVRISESLKQNAVQKLPSLKIQ